MLELQGRDYELGQIEGYTQGSIAVGAVASPIGEAFGSSLLRGALAHANGGDVKVTAGETGEVVGVSINETSSPSPSTRPVLVDSNTDNEAGFTSLPINERGIPSTADNLGGRNPGDIAGGEGDFYQRVDQTERGVISATESRFDDIALEGQARQHQMLESNQGYNISDAKSELGYPTGTLGNPNPAMGPAGGTTFLTDREAFERVLGPLPENGGKLIVTRKQLDQLKWDLGLVEDIDNGSVIRLFDIGNLNPASPLDGNILFRGPGNHLPGSGPEIIVNPAQSRVNNPNIKNDWIIEVVDD